MKDNASIRLRQFASLCRERRYKEAAKFVAAIENVWDVWPLMRSLFREWARDEAEMRHDVDAYYVTGLCRRYGMGVKKGVPIAMQAFRIAGRHGMLMPVGNLANAMRSEVTRHGQLSGIARRQSRESLML